MIKIINELRSLIGILMLKAITNGKINFILFNILIFKLSIQKLVF